MTKWNQYFRYFAKLEIPIDREKSLERELTDLNPMRKRLHCFNGMHEPDGMFFRPFEKVWKRRVLAEQRLASVKRADENCNDWLYKVK